MQARLEALERAVEGLRAEVGALRTLIGADSEGYELVGAASEASLPLLRNPPSLRGSTSSEAQPRSLPPQDPLQGPVPAAPATSGSAAGAPAAYPRTERDLACREIGLWLLRVLSGQHRGASGRERLPQGSHFWIVCRSYDGSNFSPPRVYSTFQPVKELCKRGSDLGSSVLIGLPSRADVAAVCAAAGFDSPLFL